MGGAGINVESPTKTQKEHVLCHHDDSMVGMGGCSVEGNPCVCDPGPVGLGRRFARGCSTFEGVGSGRGTDALAIVEVWASKASQIYPT